jgi:tetratricopeptide (TPR) repeat protein
LSIVEEMSFGADRLNHDDLFVDREEEQNRWKKLLSATAGTPLPVQFYRGASGEGKSFLYNRYIGLTAKAGIPWIHIDLNNQNLWMGQPERAVLTLLLVDEIQMEAPRVQLAVLFIAAQQSTLDISGRALAKSLLSDSAGSLVNTFYQTLAGSLNGSSATSFLTVVAKAGLRVYQRSKEPLRAYLRSEEGKQDLAQLEQIVQMRKLEAPGEIQKGMFLRFGKDLQAKAQPMTGNRAAKAVLLIDTLENEIDPIPTKPSELQEHRWIGELYLACKEEHPSYQPRLLIGAFGRGKVLHGIPEGEFEEHQLGGIPEEDARHYLLNVRKLPEEIVKAELEEARIDDKPLYHAFSLGLIGDAYNSKIGLPPVEPESLGRTKPEALAHRFLSQIRRGETGDEQYLARLALTPVWDDDAAAFAFALGNDREKALAKIPWLKSFSFVQPGFFPRTDVAGFTLHAIMRQALTDTSDADETQRRHEEWIGYWESKSSSPLDVFDRAAWWHRYCLDSESVRNAWSTQTETFRKEARMAEHLALVDLALAWRPWHQSSSTYPSWLLTWTSEAGRVSLGRMSEYQDIAVSLLSDSQEPGRVNEASLADIRYQHSRLLWQIGSRTNSTEKLRQAKAKSLEALISFKDFGENERSGDCLNLLGVTCRDIGNLLRDENELDQSISYFKEALTYRPFETFPEKWGATTTNKGTTLLLLARERREMQVFSEAISCLQEAVNILEFCENQASLDTAYQNLAVGYVELGIYANSLKLLIAGHALYSYLQEDWNVENFPIYWSEMENTKGCAAINAGSFRSDSSLLRYGLDSLKNSITIYSDSPGFELALARGHHNYGVGLSLLGNLIGERALISKSLEYFDSAQTIRNSTSHWELWVATQFEKFETQLRLADHFEMKLIIKVQVEELICEISSRLAGKECPFTGNELSRKILRSFGSVHLHELMSLFE